jgi:serine/threonine-protein kinase RsbW
LSNEISCRAPEGDGFALALPARKLASEQYGLLTQFYEDYGMQRVLVNIPSNPIFERVVRASADEVGQAVGLSPERIEDLKLAVSEAVNNAIEHGNQRHDAKLVEVTFTLDTEKLEVCVRDEGEGTGTIDFSRRIVEEHNLESGMHRGFGMYLIRALVDDCEVSSSHQGTTLILRLYRKEHP